MQMLPIKAHDDENVKNSTYAEDKLKKPSQYKHVAL
jgi:hypothetical protein